MFIVYSSNLNGYWLILLNLQVCTVGMDGEMRVWAGIDDDDCENISLGEEALALAVCKDR